MIFKRNTLAMAAALVSLAATGINKPKPKPKSLSGIYPHLAFYNREGECGTGAVVPWDNRLWVITYGPHEPVGSTDKLYEIAPDFSETVHKESIGGTPANRMIHKESNQLFIGPYVIDANRNVRVIPYTVMQGRLTGNARHLTDPAHKIYYATMEEGFYEVDVNSLAVKTLYADGNNEKGQKLRETGKGKPYAELPGAHGKGLYSGQGVLVFSNNGENNRYSETHFDIESGSLSEWDGNAWKLVRRNQFTEITGPGGIHGSANPATDPIWTVGWDYKSLILGVREPAKGWTFYRLPKASNSYDGAHGWNTEWPRIRNVGTDKNPDYLMTMHGMFWRFPATFSSANSRGIAPRSSYLKVIGDFTRWNNQLVFGCDDAAQKEFLNKRKIRGEVGGPGQSNSNLWFMSPGAVDHIGLTNAAGEVWESDKVDAATPSEPMLFEGWPTRTAWVKNSGSEAVAFTFEVDRKGNGQWTTLKTVAVAAGQSKQVPFSATDKGVWIRTRINKASTVSAAFVYAAANARTTVADKIFRGLSPVGGSQTLGGLLWSLPDDRRNMGVLASNFNGTAQQEVGYYELDQSLKLTKKTDTTAQYMRTHLAIPQQVVTFDKGSVLIVDDSGRRWRLPLGDGQYQSLTDAGMLRLCREVSTERDLFSCLGTFYELPAENADGFAKIRPISTHNLRINDYAAYRGLLVMTGIDPNAPAKNEHIIFSDDKKAAVWAGAIDDLWKLGKPVGHGGPWVGETVAAGAVSDPYLFGFYDKRTLELSHDAPETVKFTIEIDPIGNNDWVEYRSEEVKAGGKKELTFPSEVQGRWIRFRVEKACKATAYLTYK